MAANTSTNTTTRPPLIDLTSSSSNVRPAPLTTATEKPTAGGKKRKADDDAPATYVPDRADYNWNNVVIDKSPNQVRGMINRFLESGAMKKGEFAKALGVSSKSLNGFLTSSGEKGACSNSYDEAFRFFKQRQDAGVKEPKKKAAKVTPAAADSTADPTATDVSGIVLDGEMEKSVQVYDTCDEIRKKINAHLVKPGVTAAQFCRDLAAQLHDGSKIQAKQLTDFRSKKGAAKGNTSKVFYAAYVYFEKRRLAEKKPKSKHRLEMESAWPGGFDLVTNQNTGYIVTAGSYVYEDNLGRVRCGF